MNTEIKEFIAVWVTFTLGIHGSNHTDIVDIFEYAEAHFDLHASYYWTSWDDDRQSDVIEMCYQHWVAYYINTYSKQAWTLFLEETNESPN